MRLNSALQGSRGKQKSWKKLNYEFCTLHCHFHVQFPKALHLQKWIEPPGKPKEGSDHPHKKGNCYGGGRNNKAGSGIRCVHLWSLFCPEPLSDSKIAGVLSRGRMKSCAGKELGPMPPSSRRTIGRAPAFP